MGCGWHGQTRRPTSPRWTRCPRLTLLEVIPRPDSLYPTHRSMSPTDPHGIAAEGLWSGSNRDPRHWGPRRCSCEITWARCILFVLSFACCQLSGVTFSSFYFFSIFFCQLALRLLAEFTIRCGGKIIEEHAVSFSPSSEAEHRSSQGEDVKDGRAS